MSLWAKNCYFTFLKYSRILKWKLYFFTAHQSYKRFSKKIKKMGFIVFNLLTTEIQFRTLHRRKHNTETKNYCFETIQTSQTYYTDKLIQVKYIYNVSKIILNTSSKATRRINEKSELNYVQNVFNNVELFIMNYHS